MVKTVVLDLLSLDSVRSAAAEITCLADHVDLLINNAGISTSKLRYSVEGVESHFAINHLGHFLLTGLVLPLLLRAPSPGARVVNVSSLANFLSPVRFSDINFANEVDGPKKGTIAVPKEELHRSYNPAWSLARAPNGFPGTLAYGPTSCSPWSLSADLLARVSIVSRCTPVVSKADTLRSVWRRE